MPYYLVVVQIHCESMIDHSNNLRVTSQDRELSEGSKRSGKNLQRLPSTHKLRGSTSSYNDNSSRDVLTILLC